MSLPTAGLRRFTRHADVRQALLDPRLVFPGQAATDPTAHQAMRAAIEGALTPAALALHVDALAGYGRVLVDALPEARPVDLLSAMAEPWSLELALRLTPLQRPLATTATALARRLFDAAARSVDGGADPDAADAAPELAALLAAAPGARTRLGDVQTFVALTQTLPALLGGIWWALLQQPEALDALLVDPSAVRRSVPELMRLGSPARAVFREAAADTVVGKVALCRGERVVLLLSDANRDATRFPDPDRLDLRRDVTGALSLGSGLHRCAGAALVQHAAAVATEVLLRRCLTLRPAGPEHSAPAWRGGFAISAPAALWVVRSARGSNET